MCNISAGNETRCISGMGSDMVDGATDGSVQELDGPADGTLSDKAANNGPSITDKGPPSDTSWPRPVEKRPKIYEIRTNRYINNYGIFEGRPPLGTAMKGIGVGLC